jgi:hypothetical protein
MQEMFRHRFAKTADREPAQGHAKEPRKQKRQPEYRNCQTQHPHQTDDLVGHAVLSLGRPD